LDEQPEPPDEDKGRLTLWLIVAVGVGVFAVVGFTVSIV
jgi:hypothetical protein